MGGCYTIYRRRKEGVIGMGKYEHYDVFEFENEDSWDNLVNWYEDKYAMPDYFEYIEHKSVLPRGLINIKQFGAYGGTSLDEMYLYEYILFSEGKSSINYGFIHDGEKVAQVVFHKYKNEIEKALIFKPNRIDIKEQLPDPKFERILMSMWQLCQVHQVLMKYLVEVETDVEIIEKEKPDRSGNTSEVENNKREVGVGRHKRRVYVYENPESEEAVKDYRRRTKVWLRRGHYRERDGNKFWVEPHLCGEDKDKYELVDGKIYKVQ